MLAVLTFLCVAVPCAAPQSVQDSSRLVSGRWEFNARESDDLRRLMGAMPDSLGGRGGSRPPAGGRPTGPGGGMPGGGTGGPGGMPPGGMGGPGGMPPGGMGGSGGPPRGGGMPSAADMAARRSLFELAFRPPARLALVEDDTSLAILTDAADTVHLRIGGRRQERRVGDSISVELRAKRQDGRIILERKVRSAGKLTETYWVNQRTGQLLVLVRLEGDDRSDPVTFRRVYDRAASSQ